MALQCGIVGLPNVGKSTLFNALTRAAAAAENFPFCTIDPNRGVVPVPDPRLDRLAEIVGPERVVPTTVEFVDIAGLVKGASQGEGLGNQFLAHIREVDALLHLVRCFEDPDVVHVSGSVDPLRDVEVVETELVLADLATVERALERARRAAKSGDREAHFRKEVLERLSRHLDRGEPVRSLALEAKGQAIVKELHLLTAKPTLYVANVDETGSEGNLEVLRRYAAMRDSEVLPVSAALEAEIAQLEPEEQREFLAEWGIPEPGLNRLIRAAYRLLGLLTFFTAGPKEVRAWTVRKGAVAPEAAGKIHSDFERGFICAEVIPFEDFVRYGGEQGAREAGKLRLEGRDYVVQEGDVIRFRFNVSSGSVAGR